MFCRNCGKEMPDTAKFCGACGTPVTPPAPVGEPAIPAEDTVPVTEETAPVVEEASSVAEEAAPEREEASSAAEGTTPEREEAVPVSEEVPPAAETQPEPPIQAEEPADPVVEKASAFIPASVEEPAAGGIPASAKKRRGKGGLIVIGVAAVVVLAVAFALFKMIGGIAGGGGRAQAFAYLTDDNELMYLSNLKEKTEALEASDEADWDANVQFSKDGNTLYFLDGKNTLYKITASELKKDGRPERIKRSVQDFDVLDNGNVLFFTTSKRGGSEMHCYTGKDDFSVIKDYYRYELSKDEKTVYYTEQDEDDGTITLYKIALKDGADEEELLDGATSIYTSYDADVLVYGEDELDTSGDAAWAWDDETDRNTLTVYSCKPGGEPVELIDDVYNVYDVNVDGGKVSFYYTIEDLKQFNLYELVSDSKASADAAMTSEELMYPYWSSYYPNSAFFDGSTWSYYDDLGGPYPVDNTLLFEYYGVDPSELPEWAVRDVAYELAQDRYNAALEEYNAKYDEWSAADDRNSIRESLKSESYTQRSHSLYHYTGNADSDPIATNVNQNQWKMDTEYGVFLYKKAAGISDSKVCDVSDLSYYGEIYDYLGAGSGEDAWYQNVGGAESVLDLDNGNSVNQMYVLSDKEVVLYLSEDDDYWLDAYTLDKTGLKYASTIADGEFGGMQLNEDAKGNKTLYFFADTDVEDYGEIGDFTSYIGGKTETIAEEAYGVIILEGSGTVYVLSDYDSRGNAELSVVQNGELVEITDKWEDSFGGTIFLDSKQVLYIEGGDLQLWNGKESRRVAKDVEYVWANAEEDFSLYET